MRELQVRKQDLRQARVVDVAPTAAQVSPGEGQAFSF